MISVQYKVVLWTRDILVPTDQYPRIRSTDFRILLFSSEADKIVNFFAFFEVTFTSVFINKKSKRSQKIVDVKNFLTFFACLWKDPDPCKIVTDPDKGDPKTYGSGCTILV